MGTHPIFESDFDCLTERDMLARIARPAVSLTTKRRIFASSDKVSMLSDPRIPGYSFGVANVLTVLASVVPIMAGYMYTSKLLAWQHSGAYGTEGRKRFEG